MDTGPLRDVRDVLVPGRDVHQGPLPPLMLVLTLVTGLVDAFSYLALGRVLVANMTGNVIFLAFALAGAPQFSAAASLTALAAFAGGALAAGRIAHTARGHRGRLLLGAAAVQTALVLAAFGVAAGGTAGGRRYVLIVLLASAMGAQNAAARRLAVPDLITTVLTMTITGIAADGRVAGGPGGRPGRRLVSAAAMFAGALAGAAIVLHGPRSLALLAMAALLAALTVLTVPAARSDAAWTRTG